jgi:hypothetical protein
MAAVTITVVDKYLLKYFIYFGFATRYWAVLKFSYMLEHPKRYEYQSVTISYLKENQQERLAYQTYFY